MLEPPAVVSAGNHSTLSNPENFEVAHSTFEVAHSTFHEMNFTGVTFDSSFAQLFNYESCSPHQAFLTYTQS